MLHKQGQIAPYVKRATQRVGHWKRMVQKGHLEGIEFQEYWEKVKRHMGTTKGPIHLFAKLMNDMGIDVDTMHKWEINGTWTHVKDIENLSQMVRGQAKEIMWQQLSKQRHNYQG